MAVQLEANYSKKLGLPGYSSHQFSVSLKTELTDVTQVQAECSKLYSLLQSSVDKELQQTGFMPNQQSHATNGTNGNGTNHNHRTEAWKCSDKQRDLILKIVDEQHLDKQEIDHLAHERFGKSVRALNKLEASGLIDELIEKYPSKQPPRNGGNRPYQPTRSR